MTGTELIAAERKRQVEVEGWTPEHDAEHASDQLVMAAMCYADEARFHPEKLLAIGYSETPHGWPWARVWWKPASPIRMLVKAGALIAAEIDRRIARGETP